MALIPLSQGKFALIDDQDFEYLNQWKWTYDRGYARRNDKKKKIYLHRLINKTPLGFQTDHINKNKLDNRKCNLRTANHKVNSINRGLQLNNISGYRGVYLKKGDKKWRAYINNNGKMIHLGYYLTIQEAIMSRKNGEELWWK